MKNKDAKIIFSWTLVILWMLLIFGSSSISFDVLLGEEGRSIGESSYNIISSIVHIILYAILTLLLLRAFLNYKISTGQALVYAFLIAIIYGITDELHQYFVPGRETHLGDWLLDVAGALAVFYWYRFKIKK